VNTRTLHLIDIDNLVGADHRNPTAISAAGDVYRRLAPVVPGDQVIVACDRAPMKRLSVGLAWPGARVVAGVGPSGADLALSDAAADARWIADRFDAVVIGSGDGHFAQLARSLRWSGGGRLQDVMVVARPGTLAQELARAVAHHVRWFPRTDDRGPAVAVAA
jgi:hypothetical protein